MKKIKLDAKINISTLPEALSSHDIGNDLKSLTPGEWAFFYFSKSNQSYLGFANPFAENNKILRLVKKLDTDKFECDDDSIIRNVISDSIEAAFTKRNFYKGIMGACGRMFYGDQDGLPGLIIDQYCNVVVLQINTAGIDRYEKIVTDCLDKFCQLPILFIDNSNLRKLESMPVRERTAIAISNLEVLDNGVRIHIPINDVQKAGFYFDHSYNRTKLLHLLKDLKLTDRKVLDLFCYAGAWGFSLLKHTVAKEVRFVDQGDFLSSLSQTGAYNSISREDFAFTRGDVFKFLEANQELYDVIICDPPAFAKSNSKLAQAIEGYKKLFHQCLRRMNKNGILVAASCTYGISLEELSGIVSIEGRKLGRSLTILDLGTQRMDHPVSSLSGSGFYLKYICYHVN